jgi:hypothetical protein
MTGFQYEQFVRAILAMRLGISAENLQSAKEPGVTLPSGLPVTHQIDLLYVERSEIADYLTIIECKYRSSTPVDQDDVAKLAFVKGSVRAAKAILVTNTEFTRGAQALADAERIGLLVVRPDVHDRELSRIPTSGSTDGLFAAVEQVLARSTGNHGIIVVQRIMPSPGEGGRDLLEALVADPNLRSAAINVVRDPQVRSHVERVVCENPDLARQAIDFLRKGRF